MGILGRSPGAEETCKSLTHTHTAWLTAASSEKGWLQSSFPHCSCPFASLLTLGTVLDCSPRATT